MSLLALAGIGAIGSFLSGQSEARAIAQRERATRQASLPSPAEIQSIERLIAQREQTMGQLQSSIQRNEELLSSVDPAIRQAGEQAYRLMQGEEAKALSPIRRERDRQRRQMEAELQQRLGSGFRSSSAGIEAMLRFDDQTFSLMEQAQSNAIQTFLGASIQARPDGVRDAAAAGQMGLAFDSANIQAVQNMADRVMTGAQGVGAGQQAQAQNTGALFGAIGQFGANVLGQQVGQSMAGSGGSSGAPQTQQATNQSFGDLFRR